MKRRDAIKVAALAALAVTTASAYDQKLIVNNSTPMVRKLPVRRLSLSHLVAT
jgi:hypothetical protein